MVPAIIRCRADLRGGHARYDRGHHTVKQGHLLIRRQHPGPATGYADNIHARASGKLLMAFAPAADRERLLATSPLRPLTSKTITDGDQLEAELQKIRSERLAFDLCEFNESVYCVSAPIVEASVVVGCYTVSMPSERWPTQREHIVRAVQHAAESASNLSTD